MAYTEFYCVPATGDNLNAGSSPGSPAVSLTGGDWDATGKVFTLVGAGLSGVTADMFASVFPDATTDKTPYVARIIAVDDGADTITLSETDYIGTPPGDGTANTSLRVGGALAGPSADEDFPMNFINGTIQNAANHWVRLNLQNTTPYALTSGIVRSLASSLYLSIRGYSVVPGDGGKAVFDGGDGDFTILDIDGANLELADLLIQNCTGADHHGLHWRGSMFFIHGIAVSNVGASGIRLENLVQGGMLHEIEVYHHNLAEVVGVNGIENAGVAVEMANIWVHEDPTNKMAGSKGIFVGSSSYISWALVAHVDGDGITLPTSSTAAQQCDVFGCTGNGFAVSGWSPGRPISIRNSNSVKNGGYGYYLYMAARIRLENCGDAGNVLGRTNAPPSDSGWEDAGPVTYLDNDKGPWRDPANGDFYLGDITAEYAGRASFPNAFGTELAYSSQPDIGSQIRRPEGTPVDPISLQFIITALARRWPYIP